ncbi:MAG: hypothetical protein RBS81_00805 [Tenuifilaceae bacterium]|jgi:hypothetical protein|nr:hypothetical protein [Tenuifilaceae bacterium]
MEMIEMNELLVYSTNEYSDDDEPPSSGKAFLPCEIHFGLPFYQNELSSSSHSFTPVTHIKRLFFRVLLPPGFTIPQQMGFVVSLSSVGSRFYSYRKPLVPTGSHYSCGFVV